MGYLVDPDTPLPATPKGGQIVDGGNVYDPTEGMSFLEKLLAGTGKAFVDTGRGARQLASKVGIGDADAIQQEIDASRATDAPLMNTGAGFAGNLLGNIAMGAAVPGGGATALTRALIAAGAGGAQGALQPVATGESRAVNTAVGAGANALGSGLASGIGAMTRPAAAGSPELDAARRFALANGSDLSYAQMTGSELGARVESWLAKLPGAKKWYSALSSSQKDAVDGAIGNLTLQGQGGRALQAASAGKDWISDPQFITAMQSFPGNFNLLAGGMKPKGAIAAASEYAGAGPQGGTAMIGGRPIDLASNPRLAAAVGQASGDAKLPVGATMPMASADPADFNNYQAIRSQLGKLSFGAAEGTPDAAGYKSLRNIFDETALRSLEAQGGDPAALGQARNAYQVQKLLQGAEIQGADGSVTYSPQKAANIIDRAFASGRLKNLPDETQQHLRDIMNFARSVKPVSSSGTAENAFAGHLATGAVLGGAAEHLANPEKLGALLSTLYAAPWLVNRAMQAAMRGGVQLPEPVASTLAQIMSRAPASAALPMVNP